MEFLAGNDCSSIASIGPVIYLIFLQFQPMQLILLYSAVAIATWSQFYWCLPEMLGSVATSSNCASDNNTQQPTFPMEFLGGNDCSGIASIGPIICLIFLQFQRMQLILLYSAVAIAAWLQFYWCLPEMSGSVPTPSNCASDNNTQQPTFLMEFLAGNDCSSVALIGPIVCVSFS
jgi:hypothetical protein